MHHIAYSLTIVGHMHAAQITSLTSLTSENISVQIQQHLFLLCTVCSEAGSFH